MSDIDFESIFDSDVEGILDSAKPSRRPSIESRLSRSFEEINDFIAARGITPDSESYDVEERRLGVRLKEIISDSAKTALLREFDVFDLLPKEDPPRTIDEILDSEANGLLAQQSDILDVSSLPRRARRKEPIDVAQRVKAKDFEVFESLFRQKHEELRSGLSKLVPFSAVRGQEGLKEGAFFVMGGLMLFIAEVTEPIEAFGIRTRHKPRTRTIFENGTESNLYRRSLAGQLFEKGGLAVVPSNYEQLLADDEATGYIYVLRSKNQDPRIQSMPDLYKIGFTRGTVQERIKNAANDPTYLMAPVEVVATYRTYNLKASALEQLIHRLFAESKFHLTQVGVDGKTYDPKEWYEVPIHVIDLAVELITSGDIVEFSYDPTEKRLVMSEDPDEGY